MLNLKVNDQGKSGASLLSLLTSVSLVTVLFTASPVSAQSSDTNFGEDEIIVTARKKEESLQDIPLAISAFTEADIREKSLTQLENVAALTPGLTFEDFSNGAFGAPVIRGASQIRIDQLEQNVSVFYDGIYIPRQYAFDLGLTNTSRIEVVKGPQSALYGANSFAGAINYVSKQRNLTTLEGQVTGGIGTDGLLEANGFVNVPIIKDTLAVSVSGAFTEFDGDFDNSFPGAENAPSNGTDEDIGGWDKETYGVGVTFQKSGLTAKFDYNKFDALNEDGPNFRLNRENRDIDFNCSQGPASAFNPTLVNLAFCGQIPNDVDALTNLGPINGLLIDPRSHTDVETEILRGELNYEFNENISVNYLYGHIESDVFATSEATRDATQDFFFFGMPLGAAFAFAPSGGVEYESHELRADFNLNNGISVSVGGFIQDGEDLDEFNNVFLPLFADSDGSAIDAPDLSESIRENIDAKAVFGSINVPLLDDRLNVGLELRYTESEKDAVDGGTVFEFDEDFFTPRFSLDYQITDDNLLYASVARGVKAGGINTSSVPLTEEERFFDRDENISYEIGAKNTVFDGRGVFNAAAFYIDWDDLQSSVGPAASGPFTSAIVNNIGGATTKGVELDFTVDLSDNFTLNAGFAYTDAEYKSGAFSASRGILCSTVSTVCSVNADGAAIIEGNDIPRVPEIQWNLGGQYNGNITEDVDYFVRLDLSGQSQQYVTEVNLATVESRELLNMRAGVSKGPVSLDVWVTNLTDEEYISNAFTVAAPFDTSYIPTFGATRRAGVSVSYDF